MASAFAKSGMNQGRVNAIDGSTFIFLVILVIACLNQVEYGEGRGAQKKPGHNYPGT